jgi:hypothetical protein
MLFYKPFLNWKNNATPPWCLWAASATAGVWLVFYVVGDVLRLRWLTKPFAIAGQNVLLAYLFQKGWNPFSISSSWAIGMTTSRARLWKAPLCGPWASGLYCWH